MESTIIHNHYITSFKSSTSISPFHLECTIKKLKFLLHLKRHPKHWSSQHPPMSEASLLYMSRWKRNVEYRWHVCQVERCRTCTFGCQLSLSHYFRQKSVVGLLEFVRSFVNIHFDDLRQQVFPLPEEKQSVFYKSLSDLGRSARRRLIWDTDGRSVGCTGPSSSNLCWVSEP